MPREITVTDVVDVASGTNEGSETSQIVSFPVNENQHILMEVGIDLQKIDANKKEYESDPGKWNEITEAVRQYWISKGPEECQNYDCDFSNSERCYPDQNRKFSRNLLFRKHISGEQIKREWLLYSPSIGLIFCFACKLFDDVKSQFSNEGFCDWKHASSRITQHENSSGHRNSMFVLISRRKLSGRINTSLEIQFQIEREYWHSVLKRIVSTVKFLSTRGLAFRGQNEQINSEQNGNYLGILELISEFDPFLSNHLAKYGNKGKGRASYLSSTICEEVIQIMGEKLY